MNLSLQPLSAFRRKGICADEMPAILGLEGSAETIWEWKTGLRPLPEECPPTSGDLVDRCLQGVAARLYQERTGKKVRLVRKSVTREGTPALSAAVDAIVVENDGREGAFTPVALVSRASEEGWGPEGSGRIPPGRLVEWTLAMGILGLSEMEAGVLFRGREEAPFRVIKVEFNPELFRRLTSVAEDFWAAVVDGREPG